MDSSGSKGVDLTKGHESPRNGHGRIEEKQRTRGSEWLMTRLKQSRSGFPPQQRTPREGGRSASQIAALASGLPQK